MKIQIIKGDITKENTEAIVNAANQSLLGGGGVDGAIHRAGGPQILEECKIIRKQQGGCPAGEAVFTTGGKLPAKYVIHTVGPVWQDGHHEEKTLLENCYRNSLSIAEKLNVSSIAFPNISTGVYGFPKELAAQIATETCKNYQTEIIHSLRFVCFDDENYEIYQRLLDK